MADDETTGHSVAPGTADGTHGAGRIVVGLDGSTGSLAALHWAVQEARLRDVAVHAIMAWQHPQVYGAPNMWALGIDPSFGTQQELAAAADLQVARLREEAKQADHDVAVTYEAVEGHPAHVLVLAANDAAALVVGSRGHGGFVGALLGSVSQHVVAHANCPVVVIPGPGRGPEAPQS